MINADHKQAIIAYLTAPAVITSDRDTGGGRRAITSTGGMDARAETFQFGKQRSIPRRIVQHVFYENTQGMKMSCTCELMQNDDGEWQFGGYSGGSAGGREALIREHPWANLGGGGWPGRFFAGGYVVNNGLDIARVRLIADNGTILEDTVDDGYVLFLTDEQVGIPLQAELYDQEGKLIASHSAFKLRP